MCSRWKTMAPALLQDMATPQGNEHHRKNILCLKKEQKRGRRPGSIDVMPAETGNTAGIPDRRPPWRMHTAKCTWQGAHGPQAASAGDATHRGARAHDHKVKGLALCRLMSALSVLCHVHAEAVSFCWSHVGSTCGLVAMTSASHAEGRQFDPGQV